MNPDNRVWANPDLLKLFIWCLLKANYTKKRWVSFRSGKGRIDIEIDKGQFAYGRHSAAEDMGINPSTMRVRMEKLQSLGRITIKSASQYSLITICNYEYFQGFNGKDMPINPQAIIEANQQPDTTTKKVKKDKNEKKDKTIGVEFEILRQRWEQFKAIYPNQTAWKDGWTAWRQLFQKGFSGKRATTKYLCPLTEELFQEIMDAIPAQTKEKVWKGAAKKFCPSWPLPASWLRGERWTDGVDLEPAETVRKFEFLEGG